jgi:hypothetical protein
MSFLHGIIFPTVIFLPKVAQSSASDFPDPVCFVLYIALHSLHCDSFYLLDSQALHFLFSLVSG